MDFDNFLTFAGPAKQMALAGAAMLLIALFAGVAEAMRMRRARIDRVGWMPWTTIVVFCAVIGAGLLALSVPALLKG